MPQACPNYYSVEHFKRPNFLSVAELPCCWVHAAKVHEGYRLLSIAHEHNRDMFLQQQSFLGPARGACAHPGHVCAQTHVGLFVPHNTVPAHAAPLCEGSRSNWTDSQFKMALKALPCSHCLNFS